MRRYKVTGLLEWKDMEWRALPPVFIVSEARSMAQIKLEAALLVGAEACYTDDTEVEEAPMLWANATSNV